VKPFFTPRGFAVRALVIVVAFAVVHALGWREETRFLSGTKANALEGLVYALLYFSTVLVAPTLVLGAAIFAALERLACGKREETKNV